MRCIGVDQWAGVDPITAEWMKNFSRWEAQARRDRRDQLCRMMPSERFFRQANERFEKVKMFGIAPVDGYWRIGEWALAELRTISLDDAKDSSSFLVHLQSLYIVDTARGRGEGKWSLDQIKMLADECGCGVTLFAKSFAFSRDGHLPHAIQTFDELRKAALEEEWPVIYLPEWNIDGLRFFYEGSGFQNMCLYDSLILNRPKEEDLPFDSQFVYLPGSIDPELRRQIEHRLNRDLCKFCNR